MSSIAAGLLRRDAIADARRIIRICIQAAPETSLGHLLNAEALRLSGETLPAIRAYQRALKHVGKPVLIASREAARHAWKTASGQQVSCPRCGKDMSPSSRTCAFCEAEVGDRELLLDRYRVSGMSEALLAHAALANLLEDAGYCDEALRHLNQAQSLLSQDHADHPLAIILRENMHSLESKVIQTSSSVRTNDDELWTGPLTSDIVRRRSDK